MGDAGGTRSINAKTEYPWIKDYYCASGEMKRGVVSMSY